MKTILRKYVDRFWLAFVLFLFLLPLIARSQVALAHTNSLALEWSYPTNAVSPDLGFVIYSSNTLANPTNWPVLTVVSVTNQVAWGGAIYPFTNGANIYFVWPIAPTNQVQFFGMAASNLTGTGLQASVYPEVMPLEDLTSFLMISHP